jgi:diguanylate cyclase (GGDEF)-like protein
MTQLAKNDALTGLGNRLMLREGFAHATAESLKSGNPFAVHCLDLDGFKPINDTFGHPTGDTLLQQVARRLEAAIRTEDFVVRLGGDEFVVVQTGITLVTEAELLARRLIQSLGEPYEISGRTVRIGVSVGTALITAKQAELGQALARADAALYEAKKAGKGRARLHARGAKSVHSGVHDIP